MDLVVGADQATEAEVAALADFVPPGHQATVHHSERFVEGGYQRASALRHLLLPGLHRLQVARGWISPGGLNHLCEMLGVPPAEAYGVASFYDLFATEPERETVVRVCDDIGCRTNSQQPIEAELSAAGVGHSKELASNCLGLCDFGNAALVQLTDAGLLDLCAPAGGHPVVRSRPRRILRRIVDGVKPSLRGYKASGGFTALQKAKVNGAEWVMEQVSESGLLGRGGAAFPTGFKWSAVAAEPGPNKHVVANADESEPGTFKDRVLMEGDPFALIEGLLIAAYASGANKAWIYIRGEYVTALTRLEVAVAECEAAGLLDDGPAIEIRVGAGAYICGEETALFNSIEGFRGEPRQKPPYPTTNGLFDEPTAVNNVETLVNVLDIVNYGVDAYRSVGTAESPGTRLFCLSGNIVSPGVYEHPMGVTLREAIQAAGGATEPIQAVLLGGAAGSFVTRESLDVELSFEATRKAGLSLGSGVIMVFGESVEMADIVTRIAKFFGHESCGQCVPCRVGTKRQHEMLVSGLIDDELLADLDAVMTDASICGLGHTASTAVLSARKLGLI